MPELTVSEDVLRRIRAMRKSGEVSDNQVLERLLSDVESEKERRLRAYQQAEQDTSSTN